MHLGNAEERELRYDLVTKKINSLSMRPNERANDMYSRLNVLAEELNGLGLTQMTKPDVARKIVGLLPKDKYGMCITMLHNEDLSKATPSSVLGKITAHEMYMDFNFDDGPSTSKKKDLHMEDLVNI